MWGGGGAVWLVASCLTRLTLMIGCGEGGGKSGPSCDY